MNETPGFIDHSNDMKTAKAHNLQAGVGEVELKPQSKVELAKEMFAAMGFKEVRNEPPSRPRKPRKAKR